MYKIPLPEIKEKIIASGKIDAEELEAKIRAKINDLSGLISEEGAAHIIANEFGIGLINLNKSKLKIKEIYAGMRNLSTVGKVVQKFDVREFSKGDRLGKVCSLVLGDETGTIRVVFWNDQVDLLKKVDKGDILQITEAYVRENNDKIEIHLGNSGEIKVNPPGEVINSVREGTSYERKKIEQLQNGEDGAEILGTIVQVFDPRFFQVCSSCNKRVVETEDGFHCNEHGQATPILSYVMNIVLDDGTGNIRGVLWKNQTNHLLEKTEAEMTTYKDNLAAFEEIKNDLLGEQFKFMGRVKRNEMFDRLEFNVQLVTKAKPEEEIARLEKVR
ncbi:MAG: OB-fold nucleic acid binding domain-containing protein [Nanoarchaeota archaeon]